MFDPDTLVCEIGPIQIWHHDPCKDGSDDSCGWLFKKPNKKQRSDIEFMASTEAKYPWFLAHRAKQITSPTEGETLLRGAFIHVSQVLRIKVSMAEASEWACNFIHNQIDNFRSSIAFLPGYHSNVQEDTEYDRKYCASQFFYGIARYILTHRRHWWEHPKYHFWHWQINIPYLARRRAKAQHATNGFMGGTTGVPPQTAPNGSAS